MKKYLSEEKKPKFCSYDYRKALGRAERNREHIIEQAGKTMLIVERYHEDNMINRGISTPIAVSESKDALIAFCRKLYGADIEFDDHDRTRTFETYMGKTSLTILEIATV